MRALLFFALMTGLLSSAAIAGPAPLEPAFVRTQPFVRQHLETLQAAARAAAVSPASRPPVPAPCNASDSGDSILCTWTDVAGETGYYLYRDGDYLATLDAGVTQYTDHTTVGVPHSYCILAFNVDGVSDVCCDQGMETKLPPITFCGPDPNAGLLFRWTGLAGVDGYYVYRDGSPFASVPATQTSIVVGTTPGTYQFCVEGFAGAVTSDQCCASITPHLDTPSCAISPNGVGKVLFSWTSTPQAEAYRVYRDGILFATLTQTSLSVATTAGVHQLCVEAYAGEIVSGQCCADMPSEPVVPAAPATCSASTNLIGAIRFTWADVDNEDGYLVSRDGHAVASLPKDTTSYLDGITGSHQYCVQAFNIAGKGGACCSNGSGLPTSMLARLSWGTCDPQVHDQSFTGPAVYTLVLSAIGSATTNVGHDSELRIRPAVPDAWRFDDNGCQTGARLDLQVAQVGSCPPMLGTNPLSITSYYIDVDGSAALRLAVVYDDLTTTANQRYVLWKIAFDHTHSIAGTDADAATCDGAAIPLNFTVVPTILLSGGLALPAGMEPNDLPAYWNGGQVKTQPMTWGRVKALYR